MSGGIYRIIGNEILIFLTFIAGLWITAIFHINSKIFLEIYEFLLIFEIVPGDEYYLLFTFLFICALIIMGLFMAKAGGIKGIIAMSAALLSSWLFVLNIWFSAMVLILAVIIAVYAVRHRVYEGILGNIVILK